MLPRYKNKFMFHIEQESQQHAWLQLAKSTLAAADGWAHPQSLCAELTRLASRQ